MAKKKSIREFVSEDSLKFQLYLLKYSNFLKRLEELPMEEVKEKWFITIDKKISKWENTLNSDNKITDIEEESLKFNIKYLKNIEPPFSKEVILKQFNEKKENYIKFLKNRIEENTTSSEKADKEMLEYVENLTLTNKASKEKFGIMLLLIVKNLSSMPSFSGYSSNWKTDFYSNAIEKTLLYLNNFDDNLKSKRTGAKSKAFAYVTQICYNAFLNIIIERKQNEKELKNTISLESSNLDGLKNMHHKEEFVVTEQEKYTAIYHESKITKLSELNKAIKEGIKYIKKSNDILEHNELIDEEIKELYNNTPKNEQTQDFDNYIEYLKAKKKDTKEKQIIESLKIFKPKKLILENWKMPSTEECEGIPVIITSKYKKIKQEKELIVMEEDIFDEW